MKHYLSVQEIKVGIDFGEDVISVGRLAYRNRMIYFEYHDSFIKKGIEISPLRLPLDTGFTDFDYNMFEGLPGVFNDSLPDGWGRLLFDRFIRSQGIMPTDITPLDRLASIGQYGMGALVYEPDNSIPETNDAISLDKLAKQAQDVLKGTSDDVLQELLILNGSSAGARPKALIGVDDKREQVIYGVHDLPEKHEPWLVKFANSQDGTDAGAIEYVYALMAKEAGIEMPEVHLFSSETSSGYFAIKRFDREGNKRYHMHTACGLLHSDFRLPSLDYEDLIALTGVLTRDVREVEKMFQLAVFNVLAHNRDDHSKNFSFLMDEQGQWKVSPAYDLTFSSGPRGEQSTMIMGEGQSPTIEHLKKLGTEVKIAQTRINEIIEQTQSSLANWPKLAKQYEVSDTMIKLVGERIDTTNNG